MTETLYKWVTLVEKELSGERVIYLGRHEKGEVGGEIDADGSIIIPPVEQVELDDTIRKSELDGIHSDDVFPPRVTEFATSGDGAKIREHDETPPPL